MYLVDRITPDERDIRERVDKIYRHFHTSDKQRCNPNVVHSSDIDNLRRTMKVKHFDDLDDQRHFNRHQMDIYGFIPTEQRFTNLDITLGKNLGFASFEIQKDLEGKGQFKIPKHFF